MVLPSPGEITEGEGAFSRANQVSEAAGNTRDSGRVRAIHQSLDLAGADRDPVQAAQMEADPGAVPFP